MDKNLRAYLTEMVGTFTLVFLSACAVCGNQLAVQNNVAAPTLVGIALAGGLGLAVGLALIGATGADDAPRGYLNPAFTLTLWVFKRLDGIAAVDRHVPMQNFLEHFRVRHQSLAIGDGVLEDSLGIDFPSVRAADEVHRDVRIDEDHARVVSS